MSLINQVLKDLERRHASRADVRGLPPSVRPLPDERGRRSGWLIMLACLALLVAGGAAAWWWFHTPASLPPRLAPVAQPVSPPPSPVSQPPSPVSEAGPAQPAASSEPAATPAAVPPPAEFAPPPAASTAPATPAPPVAAVTAPPQTAPAERPSSAAAPVLAPAVASAPALSKPQEPAADVDAPTAREREATDRSPEPAGSIDKQVRPMSTSARAEAEFRRGMGLLQQGRPQDAEAALRAALEADPAHEQARQALLGVLLERGRRAEAETLLEEGLATNPKQVSLAMLLARLQLDRGAQQEALDTLLASLPNAQWSPDYLAMTAAVLTRASRHHEAAALYEAALRIGPNNAVWTMGLGLALRADGRPQEALTAFQRARDLKTLNPDLQAFVERQIRELRP